jgi:hypothetical protein
MHVVFDQPKCWCWGSVLWGNILSVELQCHVVHLRHQLMALVSVEVGGIGFGGGGVP